MIANGEVSFQPLLKCDHEEADDPLLFHANHALKINNYKKLIVASSPDKDILFNIRHHFSCWMFSDLRQLWVLRPNKHRRSKSSLFISLLKKYTERLSMSFLQFTR